MDTVNVWFDDGSIVVKCVEATIVEALGSATSARVRVRADAPLVTSAILGKPASVERSGDHGGRRVLGTVFEVTTIGRSPGAASADYELLIQSNFALLELRRRTRVFQHMSVPDILRDVVKEAGYEGATFVNRAKSTHDPREYVTQYMETDANFARRMAEDDGLLFRFEASAGGDQFILEDTSTAADPAIDEPIEVVQRSGLLLAGPIAFDVRHTRRRRTGKVTLRDYSPKQPAMKLEASVASGVEMEKALELYDAPGGFASASIGKTRATQRLEQARSDASVIELGTTAFAVHPGSACTLIYRSADSREEKLYVTSVSNAWRLEGGGRTVSGEARVRAVPLASPYRLPRLAERPRIHGLHSALATGKKGEEIHVETDGCVRVRFHWDREGPTDEKSSLPVRVSQPNTPASMLIPRVGWELMVAFEDGDPDRPYVVGRVYNQNAPPPQSLPGNKTVTTVGTVSSPGGGASNSIQFDDASGRQHFSIGAGFGKSTTVANDMVTQTGNNENLKISASQSRTVGATETVSVKQAYKNVVASQSATVGGIQTFYVKGDEAIGTGSETVLIGGACIEQVGNPVSGALNLLKSKVLSGVASTGKVGAFLSKAEGVGEAAYAGYKKGGVAGAAKAAGMGVATQIADTVPGGGALLGAVAESVPAPWDDKRKAAAGAQAAGGGAAGASDSAGAKGPGPGHRKTAVSGAMIELVGAMHSVTTPGTIGWTTIGASTVMVGASRSVTAATVGSTVMGISTDVFGSLSIDASGSIERAIKGPVSIQAATMKSSSGDNHVMKSNAKISLTLSGALTIHGSPITFRCGGSSVSITPDSVSFKSSSVTITGVTKSSGSIERK